MSHWLDGGPGGHQVRGMEYSFGRNRERRRKQVEWTGVRCICGMAVCGCGATAEEYMEESEMEEEEGEEVCVDAGERAFDSNANTVEEYMAESSGHMSVCPVTASGARVIPTISLRIRSNWCRFWVGFWCCSWVGARLAVRLAAQLAVYGAAIRTASTAARTPAQTTASRACATWVGICVGGRVRGWCRARSAELGFGLGLRHGPGLERSSGLGCLEAAMLA